MGTFTARLHDLVAEHNELTSAANAVDTTWNNGVINRYVKPILTAEHTPLYWRYDLNEETNPRLLERLGINAILNPGAIYHDGAYYVMARIEGADRKSFFGLARSENGIDNFRFHEKPIVIPEVEARDVNVYDMRITKHEDGYFYGVFCSERKDTSVPASDTSTAVASAGIVRSQNLIDWERLPDLKTNSAQQRNAVVHPEFVDGKYAIYTRPQDGFIDAGSGGGIGWGLTDSMENAVIEEETLIDERRYHTINEVKNGQGPAPIKTDKGWLHLAHGVRNTAAGLRYVLYMMLSDLDQPWKITHRPSGAFMVPRGEECVGDVSNVLFANGWAVNEKNEVFIYYASSDTRIHVATSDVETLLDYVMNTPEDPLFTADCVSQRIDLVEKNLAIKDSLPTACFA